ncbi:uncharacterized protein CEXT_450201 [Caerostris extrusa]|uniref:Uncharacterized protein n=1 Tax=Caerostris extrusa TaxID=172846 RepID=A0AAV4XS01_CAEEX|nr:uncharacterized protein CEXT_450201 [Caerostris extrusa]
MQKEFLKSVTARLTVAQVVEKVRNDGSLSFDFIMFVFIASCIAALGLSENSAIVIVAAMLISPIMGPIMAFTFGLTIRDKKLVRMALRTETHRTQRLSNCSETWGAGKWPTTEMAGRGMMRSLWSGCLIALPSGAGVAMSVLGGNGASLVGVAISASLLPPTVNCGLLWGLAAIKTVRSLYQNTYVVYDIYNHTVKPALLPPDTYTPTYYPLMDKECAVLGIISFLLTVLNIICIIMAALVILKVKKEVAPNTTEPAISRFWKHDVKVARDYNKTLGENEGEDLGKQFLEEWANLNGIDPSTLKTDTEESRLTQLQTLMDIVEDAQEDDVFRSISMSNPAGDKVSRRLSIAPGMTLQDAGPTLRRASIAQGGLKGSQMKKRRQSRLPNLMDAVREDEGEGNEIPRKSVIYNQSLQNSENPYSMWPSKSRIQEMTRFNVSPVNTGDVVSPLPSIRNTRTRRRSCHPGQRPSIPGHRSEPHGGNGKTESTAF